jgi:hypothetical protein
MPDQQPHKDFVDAKVTSHGNEAMAKVTASIR